MKDKKLESVNIPRSPMRAIREKCMDCSVTSPEVALCPVVKCPLHAFRFGKNPHRSKREVTEEQREKARERFARIRAEKAASQNVIDEIG